MKKLILAMLFISMSVFAQDSTQTFLSLKPTGVEAFHEQYPEFDGRGTIVMIFDTGVDMGIPGLTTTSTGEVKVIDVQDFTGQGDLPYYEADVDDEDGVYFFINEDHNMKVNGADKLTLKAIDDEYYIGALEEKLWTNSSSGASDVNGNGSGSDKFDFVVFQTEQEGEKFWVVYFDTNDDGDLSDEKPLRNYKEKFDSFQIPNLEGLPNFTFGLNIFPEESKIVLHFDDGAHGTHCAGIATGNKINDGDLYGVAPGAYVMSMKLGNNNFAGGATVTESMKKCFLYADKISKERKEPVVINMSFGIGSEIEGQSDMELFLDQLVDENPYLYICTSNGNEGPGISTAGLPAASDHVFASGAVLTQEVGSDLYGAELSQDVILHFSSRGGEVSKPDAVSPGACISTVPNWAGGDRFWGTSMASPYSAGVMSLLLSAANKEFPDVKIPSRFLFKVVREAAVPFDNYKPIDQGGGYINVPNAWELLKKYIKSGELKKFETYTISSFAPNMPNGTAPNIYIRNGSYLTGNETLRYRVSRDNFQNQNKFYRSYHLVSDSDWLVPVQKNIYIKNDQSANINVMIDKNKMTKPGMYNARITAYRSKTKIPEFDMMATVVIPLEFDAENNYRMQWKDLKLEPGFGERYFINVPAGAASMHVRLTSDDGEYTFMWYHLHNPSGRQISTVVLNATENENEVEQYYYNLEPGIYELVTTGFFTAKNTSEFNMMIEFGGIDMLSSKTISSEYNNIELINNFNKPERFAASAKIEGYQLEHVVNLNGADVFEYPFVLNKGESVKSFEVSISKEDFNKITDFAIQIYNEDGIAVAKTGLSYDSEEIRIRNRGDEDSVKYVLELRPAFANEATDMKIYIKENTGLSNAVNISLNGKTQMNLSLYPSIKEIMECSYDKPDVNLPIDSKVFGTLYLKNSNDKTEFEFPLYLKFKE